MPPRNHKNWLAKPKVESVSSEIYSSQKIFDVEIESIFSKVWVPVCHISEMYNELDYYMFDHLWFEETNDEYVKYEDKLIKKILKELTK